MQLRVFALGQGADPHAEVDPETLVPGAMKVVWGRSDTLTITLDPATAPGGFIVLPALWAPGWSGEFGLTVSTQPTDESGRPVRLELQELAPLRPSAEAAEAMRPKLLSNKCATCGKPCPRGRGNKYFKQVRWHADSCYHCYACKTPFEQERRVESYTFSGPAQAGARGPHAEPRAIHDVEEADGALRGFCLECYRESFAPRCLHCGEVVDKGKFYSLKQPTVGRVHSHCYEAFRASKADPCLVCGKPVIGSYYATDDGKVHSTGDCYQKYLAQSAPTCYVCQLPILDAYYTFDEGPVHSTGDCADRYYDMQAPKCLVCGLSVKGQYYEVDEGAIHAEGDCLAKYQAGR